MPGHQARLEFERILFGIRALFLPRATLPVPTFLTTASAAGRSERLVVLLPGRGSRARHFDRHRFAAIAREQRLAADILAVDLHFGYYLKADPLVRLRLDVLDPSRAAGYSEIHLVGISVGAAAALGLAHDNPGRIAGLLLMGPYLGSETMVEEIAAAGLARWTPDAASLGEFDPFFARNWEFLRRSARQRSAPPILLAFGESDRYAAGQRLLAEALPRDRVFTAPGRHDWTTWSKLWETILSRGAFPAAARRDPAETIEAAP